MAEKYPECQIDGLDIVNETILRNQKKVPDMKNCHFPVIGENSGEISRVLKRGGLLLILDPVPNPDDLCVVAEACGYILGAVWTRGISLTGGHVFCP